MQVFFASAGRMGRAPFLAAAGVLLGLFWAYERFVRGGPHAATAWLVHFVLFVAAASVLAKRLHDRGRSGWWAAVVLLAFDLAWPWPRGILGWAGAVVLVIAAVDLGLAPGEPRFNRFGPPAR